MVMTQTAADEVRDDVKPLEAAEPVAAVDAATFTGPIEAILLSTDRPVQAIKLAIALGLVTEADVEPEVAVEVPAVSAAAASPVSPVSSDGAPAPAGASAEGEAELPAQGLPVEAPVAVKPKRKRKAAAPQADLKAKALAIVNSAVEMLNESYEKTDRSFRIERLAGGYRVMTLPAYASAIAAYQGARAKTSLSPAAIEALAIISYKQPVTRAKLEAIRGVACGEILRSLMERHLITIVGRAEELGRPILYGTSKRFLELFGLASLKDLPSVDELLTKS